MTDFYAFQVPMPDGTQLPMENFRGKVVLLVNTATECGFTPQFETLEHWHRKYAGKGLQILSLPCNQFGGQAPGTDEEIHQFCRLHYNTTFPQTAKIQVNGPEELPLYTFLKAQKGFAGFGEGNMADLLRSMLSEADPDYAAKSDIKWNFTKFIVDRTGKVAARFEPTADLDSVEAFFRTLL